LSEHQHIQVLVGREKQLHFQKTEFDLDPLIFMEALLLTISPVSMEMNTRSWIKNNFFSCGTAYP
jgi:hypothetical protein